MFTNLKKFHLKFIVDEFANLRNATENESMRFVFRRSLDILLDKDLLNSVNFTITIPNMQLLLFETFVDSLSTFLSTYRTEIAKGI